jgi:hypothetical protein
MLLTMKVTALSANIPSRRLQSIQAFFMNLVPPSSRFSSAAAKKDPFSPVCGTRVIRHQP